MRPSELPNHFRLHETITDLNYLLTRQFLFFITEDPSAVGTLSRIGWVWEYTLRTTIIWVVWILSLLLDYLVFFFLLILLVIVLWTLLVLLNVIIEYLFTGAILKNPFVINMINSCLVPANTFVRSYLNMTVKIPTNHYRRIIWHELYCFGGSWSSYKSQHQLSRNDLICVNHWAHVWSLYALLILFEFFVLTKIIKYQTHNQVTFSYANHGPREQNGGFLDSYESSRAITHIFNEKLVLRWAESDFEMTFANSLVVFKNDVIFRASVEVSHVDNHRWHWPRELLVYLFLGSKVNAKTIYLLTLILHQDILHDLLLDCKHFVSVSLICVYHIL